MEAVIALIVLPLAVYRITRLLIEDEILDGPREAVFSRVKRGGKLEYLMTCYWCMSFWVAIPLSILYIVSSTGMMVIGLPFAVSAIVGLLNQKVENG